MEDQDIYDGIFSYLLDEGYAETPEAAKVIMINMSEEWKQELVEFFFKKMKEREIEKAKEEREKRKKARKASESQSRSPGRDPWSTHPSDAKMHAKEDR